jgi:hypothetical protein
MALSNEIRLAIGHWSNSVSACRTINISLTVSAEGLLEECFVAGFPIWSSMNGAVDGNHPIGFNI